MQSIAKSASGASQCRISAGVNCKPDADDKSASTLERTAWHYRRNIGLSRVLGWFVVEAHQLIAMQCGGSIRSALVVTELDFVYSWREVLNDSADLSSFQSLAGRSCVRATTDRF